MNEHRLFSALLGLIVSAAGVAASPSVTPKETVGEFLLRSEREAAVPFVQYCASVMPENKDALESEYAKFQERFQAAASIFMQRHGSRADLSKQVRKDLVKAYQQEAKRTLAEIQKQNPREYCPWLLTTFTTATPDAIQTRLERMLIQYEVLKLD
jgi:hypothetical protein